MQWKLKQFLKLGGGDCNQGELNRKQAGIATRDNGSQGLAFFKIPTTNGFAPVFRIRNGIGSFPHRTDRAVRGSLMELEWKACNSVWRETGGLVVSGARKEFLHIAARSAAEPLRQRGWAQSLVGEDVGSIITRRYFSSKAASSAELLKKMLASLNCVVGRLEVLLELWAQIKKLSSNNCNLLVVSCNWESFVRK